MAATAIAIVDKTTGREGKHRGPRVRVIRATAAAVGLAHGGEGAKGSGGRGTLALGRVAVAEIFSPRHAVPVLILIHCIIIMR